MKEPGWPFGNRPTPRKVWALWKAGRVMECEINAHPLGHEVRLYQGGEFQSAQVFATVELVEADAADRRREFMAAGWTERAPVTEWFVRTGLDAVRRALGETCPVLLAAAGRGSSDPTPVRGDAPADLGAAGPDGLTRAEYDKARRAKKGHKRGEVSEQCPGTGVLESILPGRGPS